ncbi:MAG: trypsin-like peptidase domain-containing protein [Desulfobacteraceae bacterium]|nr:trypsin-like peptidase domain-containing protein [Desulfobacteraceae bacterium]
MSYFYPEQAIVRILNENNKLLGSGILVSYRHVMTCSHVIKDSSGNIRQDVSVDFPLKSESRPVNTKLKNLTDTGHTFQGRKEHVAVLEMPEDVCLPANAKPVSVSALSDWKSPGISVKMCGFKPNAKWSFGTISGWLEPGMAQIDHKHGHMPARKGFSGTAVWREKDNAIMGMIIEVDDAVLDGNRWISTTHMIPGSLISKAWHDINPPEKKLLLPYLVDRRKQVSKISGIVQNNGKNENPWPLICILHGNTDECHEEFLECLRGYYWKKKIIPHGVQADEPALKDYEWPYEWYDRRRHGSQDCFEDAMLNKIGRSLGVESEQVAESFIFKSPLILHTTIYSSCLKECGEQLIRDFVHFWENWNIDIQPNCPFITCLVIKYETHIREKQRLKDLFSVFFPSLKSYEKINRRTAKILKSGYEQAEIPELAGVEWNDADRWTKLSDVREFCARLRINPKPIIQSIYEGKQKIPMQELAQQLTDRFNLNMM